MFQGIAFFLIFLSSLPLIVGLIKNSKNPQKSLEAKIGRKVWYIIAAVLLIIIFNIIFFLFSEWLWFDSLDFTQRFWTEVVAKTGLFISGAAFSFLFLFFNSKYLFDNLTMFKRKQRNIAFTSLLLLFALLFGSSAYVLWEKILLFLNQTSGTTSDPIFNMPLGFYLFSLPLYRVLAQWLSFLVLVQIALSSVILFILNSLQASTNKITVDNDEKHIDYLSLKNKLWKHTGVLAGIYLIFPALFSFLDIFRLLYSSRGAVQGIGWTDHNFRIFGYAASSILLVISALLVISISLSPQIRNIFLKMKENSKGAKIPAKSAYILPIIVIFLIFLFNTGLPGIAQTLIVSPNELALEKEYIKHNIDYTQIAYKIDDKNVEHTEYDVQRNIDAAVIENNRATINNARLWDWRALINNLREQQEIRLYYQFNDVDIDRYTLEGNYRETMIAARELEKSELAQASKTWVAEHLKYTHGYGAVLLPVNQFLSQGRPDFFIKNIPPEISIDDFKFNRPEIYYGERTTNYVLVNTKEEEFDYPAGNSNSYTHYKGDGGVQLKNFLHRLLFSWKFDDYRIMFTQSLTQDSRIMFYRQILQRVNRIAPFLVFENDPYVVITDDGHLKYMIDAYTVSRDFPYSQPYEGERIFLNGINYIRNSVKVVIDAYDGKTDLYMIDKKDIMITTYNRIFPGIFKPFEDMPEDLKKHIRYPVNLLKVQSEILKTYHINDPEIFYQREDLWDIATEKYRADYQSVEPYYVMIHFPEEEREEFVLMLPFTPQNKNVINAWIAGRSDFPHYGELKMYTFPKGVEVLGPRQIEAQIDQNTEMSESMTLWGQRGSNVIRGNLLTLPLFSENKLSLLYIEPIYLQAEGTNLPEIKRIVAADQTGVYWDTTLEAVILKIQKNGTEEKLLNSQKEQE